MASKEIRTILAALTSGHVLLPSSAVAEVLEFKSPDPFNQGPAWLLGELVWRGWQVPVIDFQRLADESAENPVTPKARILVIKTLGESTQVNYIGLVIQGLPKLKTVDVDKLVETNTKGLHEVLFSEVSIDGQAASIPEIGKLTHMVELAAYGS